MCNLLFDPQYSIDGTHFDGCLFINDSAITLCRMETNMMRCANLDSLVEEGGTGTDETGEEIIVMQWS